MLPISGCLGQGSDGFNEAWGCHFAVSGFFFLNSIRELYSDLFLFRSGGAAMYSFSRCSQIGEDSVELVFKAVEVFYAWCGNYSSWWNIGFFRSWCLVLSKLRGSKVSRGCCVVLRICYCFMMLAAVFPRLHGIFISKLVWLPRFFGQSDAVCYFGGG